MNCHPECGLDEMIASESKDPENTTCCNAASAFSPDQLPMYVFACLYSLVTGMRLMAQEPVLLVPACGQLISFTQLTLQDIPFREQDPLMCSLKEVPYAGRKQHTGCIAGTD